MASVLLFSYDADIFKTQHFLHFSMVQEQVRVGKEMSLG